MTHSDEFKRAKDMMLKLSPLEQLTLGFIATVVSGRHDTAALAELGERYAVDVLGMVQAPRNKRSIDGWINGKRTQVKTLGPSRMRPLASGESTVAEIRLDVEHIVMLKVDADGEVAEIYNGPAEPVKAASFARARKRDYNKAGKYPVDAWVLQDVPSANQELITQMRADFGQAERERRAD